MKKIRKFLRLSQKEQLLFMYAVVILGMVTVGLRILPWIVLQQKLLKLAHWSSKFVSARRPPANLITWIIKVAGALIPKATCLPQALAAQFMLVQNAYPVELKIGITRNDDGILKAHAWVTSEGGILIGGVQDLDHFVPLSAMHRQGLEDYGKAV